MNERQCWVMTDGRAGNENQCLGLAEAVGLPVTVKRIALGAPWKWLPPPLVLAPRRGLARGSDAIVPPWPRLLIAAGRHSVATAAAVRRAANGDTFAVQVFRPGLALDRFDLVVAPRHDRLSGANVIATRGSLHRVTPQRLAAEAERFRDRIAALPRPLVAVLVGGSNSCYRMTPETTRRLADRLHDLCRDTGAGLAITPSRRTGAENERILRQRLGDVAAEIWDGHGDNPYFGYLGLADAIVVTCDSVNMVSEACATGKPVHVYELEGGNDKFRRFHQGLRDDGITRPFLGRLESWSYEPLDDTARVATEIRRRIGC